MHLYKVNWKHHQLDLNTNWNHTLLREHMTNATRNVERTLQLYFHQAYPQIALHFCSYSFHVSVFSLFWNGMLVLPFLLAMVVLLFVLSLYTRPALYFPSAFACARLLVDIHNLFWWHFTVLKKNLDFYKWDKTDKN